MQGLPKVLDPLPGGRHLVDAVDYIVNWARANSLWPLTYGTSCCAIEMMAASMPRYDISRFGSEVFRATPRQADLIILAGTIVDKMAGPLKTLYDQLPGPKYVIAMGACTISGGPFYYDNYSVVKGADRVIPVDVYIPGCPPRPEALFHGLMLLQEKIKAESLRKPWTPEPVYTKPFGNPHAEAAQEWEAQEKEKDAREAESRAKFLADNPGYKPFKHERVVGPVLAEVPRVNPTLPGSPKGDLFERIVARFPGVKVDGAATQDRAGIEALRPDEPLTFVVPEGDYLPFAQFLKEDPALDMDLLLDISAVDWEEVNAAEQAKGGAVRPRFDLTVQMLSTSKNHLIFYRVPLEEHEVPDEARKTALLAEAPTLSHLYPGANWKEREVYDMFGIKFHQHPDLRRLFLPDDFEGYPLRKDFTHPHMVKRPY